METTDYNKQANDFLHKTDSVFKAELIKNDFHFDGDEQKRDIYKITLSRGVREYTFDFGQSINDSKHYIDKTTGDKYVCVDGPVFNFDEVQGNWD